MDGKVRGHRRRDPYSTFDWADTRSRRRLVDRDRHLASAPKRSRACTGLVYNGLSKTAQAGQTETRPFTDEEHFFAGQNKTAKAVSRGKGLRAVEVMVSPRRFQHFPDFCVRHGMCFGRPRPSVRLMIVRSGGAVRERKRESPTSRERY